MQASSIPTKFSVPFGADATSSYIRSVPVSQPVSGNGQASLDLGFPPECFTPTGAGGYAPDGRDFNGILNQISAWCQWAAAGGAPVAYDSTFQTAIGGYPQGAVVTSAAHAGVQWLSTVDNNTTDPDTGGAGWTALMQTQSQNYAADTGTPNAYSVSLTPALTAHVVGMPIRVKIANTNTGASTFNPGPGAVPIVDAYGNALTSGVLIAGRVYTLVYDGASYQLLSPSAAGFSSSLGTNSWQKLPSGLIVQMGTHTFSTTQETISLPISFSSQPYGGVVTDAGAGRFSYGISFPSNNQATMYAPAGGTVIAWWWVWGK